MNAAEVAHPSPGAEILLAVDASGSHVGVVLNQWPIGGHWRPLVYFLVKLDQAQTKYFAFDHELPACYLGDAQVQTFSHTYRPQKSDLRCSSAAWR